MISILISNFFILCMFTYLGYSLFPSRFLNKRINCLLFIICYILASLINFNGASSKGLILLCILHFLYFFIMYTGKTSNCLLALIPFPLIIVISEFFTANILNIIIINFRIDINSYLFAFANFVSNIFTFIILLIYIKISKLFIQVNLPGFTWIIFLLPISSFILLFEINDMNLYLLKNDHILFISIIGIFLSNFIVLYIFYNVILSIDYKQKLENASNREKLSNQKYELMSEHYNANFNFLHRLLNTCNKLNKLIIEKKYEVVIKELNSLYYDTYTEFNAIYSNSLILNYLLVERLELLNKNKILFKSVIEYNNFQFLSLNEQELLFSTLLDDAIKESQKIYKPRTLIIKTQKIGFQIIIQVIFSSDCTSENEIKIKLDLFLKAHNALYSEKLDIEKQIKSVLIVFLDKTKI